MFPPKFVPPSFYSSSFSRHFYCILNHYFTSSSLQSQSKMSRGDCRNVEIKAKLFDENEFNEKVNIAKKLTGKNEAELIKQHDVFFKASVGRLKLRYEEGRKAKLVQYERDNVQGPKLSKFSILEVENGELMEKILDESIGKKFSNIQKLISLLILKITY